MRFSFIVWFFAIFKAITKVKDICPRQTNFFQEILTKIQKILEYIESQGLSFSEFERRSGLGASYLTKTRDRGAELTLKVLEKIRDNNPNDYYAIFPEESNLVQEPSLQYNGRTPKTETDPEREGITFIPISAQAGYSMKRIDPVFNSSLQKIYIPGMPYRGDNYRIWEVEGHSMEPTFREGYWVVTEKIEGPWNKIKEFHVYVVVTEDDVMLKRLKLSETKPGHWVLISDNEELYPPILLPVEEVKELWFAKRKMDWEMPPPKRFNVNL